ncbi:XRE family transcriptional regulator [Puteibacter caeruleilacunae]|nr:XRE family transcriptional regulator [Puteibacter caeruleilacunae]
MCSDSVYVRRESVELARQHQKEQLLAQRKKDRKRKLSADVKAINPNLSIEISELINSEIQPPCDELSLKLLGQQIQDLRNQKGITQEQFGILIGRSRSQVGRIESGKQEISISLLLQIMKALNARVVYRLETDSQ